MEPTAVTKTPKTPKTPTAATETASNRYRACVLRMAKSMGPAHADAACGHLKLELLRCVARDRCPSESDSVEALCGGSGRKGRACAVAMAGLDACLSDG